MNGQNKRWDRRGCGMKRHRSSVQHEFEFIPRRIKHKRLLTAGAATALAVLMVYSGWQLVSYATQWGRSRAISREMQEAYNEGPQSPETENQFEISPAALTEAPTPTPTPTAAPTQAVSSVLPAEATEVPMLTPRPYPGNPMLLTSTRIQRLQRSNKDIIGYLSIDGLVNEAVVQRDNSYYLRRDSLGYHNVNGAIFLDENISLHTRPYTLILYGHNMKTGTMFGCFHKFENMSYYKSHPFLSFDTKYEDGRYVIFALSRINLQEGRALYVPFSNLAFTGDPDERQSIIDLLRRRSSFSTGVDVQTDDQLLLMVTCIGNDDERNILIARRLRDGETEESLLLAVASATSR